MRGHYQDGEWVETTMAECGHEVLDDREIGVDGKCVNCTIDNTAARAEWLAGHMLEDRREFLGITSVLAEFTRRFSV